MNSFECLRQRTYCPFAASAKVEHQFYWSDDLDFLGNVQIHAVAMREFTQYAQERKYHGFVAKIYAGSNAKCFETTRLLFGEYLYSLAKFDQDCAQCLDQEKYNVDWQFSFNKLRMFLNVFSPCYSVKHSKYVDSEDSFYIFFQPEYSFNMCGSKPLDRVITKTIRKRFSEAGQAYDGELIDQRIEALLYMFPEKLGDPPVVWWK